MPIYEYECENKHRFEKWQSMKDESLKECPECGTAVRKILHPAGIIFKGSGWYVTDSRKSDTAGADESKSDKSDGKGEGKSEGKSEGGETKSEGESKAKKEESSESKSESKSEPKTESKSESKGESKPASSGSGGGESKSSSN